MQEAIVFCFVSAAIGFIVICALQIAFALFGLLICVVIKAIGLYAEFRAFLASRRPKEQSAVQIIGPERDEWS